METARRHSAQRDNLRAILHGRTDHPDAQKIYDELKAVMPRISLGTVYRNLMLLADEGELQVLDVGDGKVRFDPNAAPHAHFLCTKCHRVSDMPEGSYTLKVDRRAAAKCGSISACSVSFTGICPDCQAKKD
jgi:Fur family peroxide stress response transcriptional regulator